LADWLEKGIGELMEQCQDLEKAIEADEAGQTLLATPKEARLGDVVVTTTTTTMKLKHSSLAKRQIKLMREEDEWRRSYAIACWTVILANITQGPAGASKSMKAVHRLRTLSV
jgi:hypothetical protein